MTPKRRFNYPKHPLFGIAPLLDRGFGTVLHDEYTSRLVGRIRAGRYTPELWDCNSFHLNYVDRLDGRCDGQRRIAVKSRYTMTAEQRRAWNNSYGDPALNAERAKRAAKEKQLREEQSLLEREWAERRARELAERARRDREWEESEARRRREWEERKAKQAAEAGDRKPAPAEPNDERAAVLKSRWECSSCHRPSIVMPLPEGKYQLTCPRCVRTATADHATMVNIIMARNIVGFPLNAG